MVHYKNWVLSNELIKVELPPLKIKKAAVSSVSPSSERKTKGLTFALTKGERSERRLSKSFTAVIQPLSTRLIKPNFCFHLSHRRSTTVSLETRNPSDTLRLPYFLFWLFFSSFLQFPELWLCFKTSRDMLFQSYDQRFFQLLKLILFC